MSRSQDPIPPQPNTRRTVLRAGFGIPLVTAVTSGSALAASSTTCLARQTSSPARPVVTSAGKDTYLRVELGSFKPRSGGGAVTFFVDGDNVQALAPTLRKSTGYQLGYGSSVQYRPFDVASNTEGGLVNPKTNKGEYTRTSGQFAALRFDASGEIVGVGQSSAPGQSAVIGSCWSSLAPRSA